MAETWKKIPGVDETYEVSDKGNVRSLPSGKILKPWAHPRSGHLQVRVVHEETGKRSTRYIHHLVLLSFVGERPEGSVGRHLNDVPGDNRASNLAWGTASENTRDSVRNGTNRNIRKVECPRGHSLAKPNLVAAKPKGHRECLACSRERASSRKAGRPFDKQLSDAAFRRIWPEVSDA